MTEKDQIHTLLADLAGEDPPVDIDLDRQIKRGQRRVRRRTVTLCVAAVAVSAVAVGGIVTFRPDANRSDPPVADPTTPTAPPTPTSETPTTPKLDGSTERSRALLAQAKSLVPEFADPPRARLFDREVTLGKSVILTAGADWGVLPDGNWVTIAIEVGRRDQDTITTVCDGVTGTFPCTEVRHLSDGSIAYLHSYQTPPDEGHSYEVRLDRPDGIRVHVDSSAVKPKGTKYDAKLSLERVLEIAQQITVRP